jgi:hypothetical protein
VGIAKALYVGTTANIAGTTNLAGLTASSAVATDASKNLVSVTNTGTGNNVLATSPTLVTPILGTPASGIMTNVTGINYDGFKNRIINGQMVIAQRATSVIGADLYCCVDRFDFSRNTIVWNAAQSTDVPSTTSFRYSTSVTVTTNSSAAGAYAYIYQAIEGYNWADLGYGTASAQTSVLSFWVKSSLTGTFGIALRNATGSSRFFTTTYTINAANTWEQKTITITGDTAGTWNTTNGVGLAIFWDLGVGSTYSSTSNNAWSTVASNFFGVTGATKLGATNGATFYITGVQLEKGSTATSFDYRPIGTELQLCQRYYETTSYPNATQDITSTQTSVLWAASFSTGQKYLVAKRAAPTITIFGRTNAAGGPTRTDTGAAITGTSTASSIGATGFWAVALGQSLASYPAYAMEIGYTASAEL